MSAVIRNETFQNPLDLKSSEYFSLNKGTPWLHVLYILIHFYVLQSHFRNWKQQVGTQQGKPGSECSNNLRNRAVFSPFDHSLGFLISCISSKLELLKTSDMNKYQIPVIFKRSINPIQLYFILSSLRSATGMEIKCIPVKDKVLCRCKKSTISLRYSQVKLNMSFKTMKLYTLI